MQKELGTYITKLAAIEEKMNESVKNAHQTEKNVNRFTSKVCLQLNSFYIFRLIIDIVI